MKENDFRLQDTCITTESWTVSSRRPYDHFPGLKSPGSPVLVKLEFHGTDTDTGTDTDFRDAPIV